MMFLSFSTRNHDFEHDFEHNFHLSLFILKVSDYKFVIKVEF